MASDLSLYVCAHACVGNLENGCMLILGIGEVEMLMKTDAQNSPDHK
jgi:hypothetical protein